MVARRLGRKTRTAEEPLLQWRRQGRDADGNKIYEHIVEIYCAILTPLSFQRGRDTSAGNVTFLTNPAFILINPATDRDGRPIDVAQGDLFARLRYLEPPYKVKEDGTKEKHDYKKPYTELEPERQDDLKDIAFRATHHTLTVHSFETQFNGIRLLGELQT